jgi:hypothetical protein
MLNGEIIVSALKEVIRRADNTDPKLGIRAAAEKAHRRIICGGEFPSQLVMHALVLGCWARKASRLHETCLSCLQHIAFADCLARNATIDLFGKATTIGVALVEAVLEVLAHSDPAAQMKALDCFSLCLEDVSGPLQVKAILCCFNLALASGGKGAEGGASPLHVGSSGMLTSLVHRVVTQFVVDSCPASSPEIFYCTTQLDFFSEADPMDQYIELATPLIEKNGDFAAEGGPVLLRASTASSAVDLRQSADLGQTTSISGLPAVASATSGLAPSLRDLLIVFRFFCTAASKGIATSSLEESSLEVRARLLALKSVFLILSDLPSVNCDSEHRCSAWLSTLFQLAKYDLLRSIARNVATAVPGQFFTTAMEILGILMAKFHYHAHEELSALLDVVVFPLAVSKVSTFNQKFEVLRMLRGIVESPSLLVSYFINYDCNPQFDAAGKSGGMLEMLLQFTCDMMFSTVHNSLTQVTQSVASQLARENGNGAVSPDQDLMLRCECVRIIHKVTESFRRWIFDDPKAKESSTVTTDVDPRLLSMHGHRPTELFLDNWSSEDDDSDPDDPDTSNDCMFPAREEHGGSFSMAMSPTVIGAAGSSESDSERFLGAAGPGAASAGGGSQPASSAPFLGMGRRKHVRYHWKHIHQQLCNKRIVQEAASRFNTNWRHGRTFLTDRGVIKEGETLSFARFLRNTPSIDRKMLCSLFEKVTKDEQCADILAKYLSTFDYRGVPIDVALRDTTCEFMSWTRPQFEAQVWEKIQGMFGEEYARQNEGLVGISPRDADAMAGVLLFLHTSLHNANARSARMTEEQFVRDGSACLVTPLPAEEMRAMYARIAARRWGLDSNSRNPRQQEIAEMRVRISSVIASPLVPANPSPISLSSVTFKPASAPDTPVEDDALLLSASVAAYADDLDRFRLQQAQQAYVRAAQELLLKLEKEIRECQERTPAFRQPYIPPHFAQHVRPMLLLSYPQLAACAYLGLRTLRHEPILRLILDFYQNIMDVSAAFVINLSDLHSAVERTIQQGLRQGGVSGLGALRVSLAPFFMNRV